MRTRSAVTALTALAALVSAAPLLAQDDAMMKDKAMNAPAEGMFAGAGGHKAAGTVHLLGSGTKRQLHFTPDFKVDKGPDVYVALTDSTRRVTDKSLVVGKLSKTSGEQLYDLPAGADLGGYTHVVLWSKKNRASLGEAPLGTGAMDGMMKDESGMMKDEGGMMKDETGMMKDEDGMMKDEGGMEKDEDGMKKDESGMEKDDGAMMDKDGGEMTKPDSGM